MLRLLLLVLCVVTPMLADAANDASVSGQVRRLEAMRLNAMVHKDFGTLQRLLSDGLAYVHTDGTLDTKQSLLTELRTGNLTYVKFPVSESQIRVFGNTAVITGRAQPEPKAPGAAPRRLQIRFLDVWVRSSHGGWQLVAWQSTRVQTAH